MTNDLQADPPVPDKTEAWIAVLLWPLGGDLKLSQLLLQALFKRTGRNG